MYYSTEADCRVIQKFQKIGENVRHMTTWMFLHHNIISLSNLKMNELTPIRTL